MSETSAVLALPYIQPSQAQKHVTHNEALRVLDVIVQLAVLDRVQVVAPATPAIGDRYIVAPAATGAWAGQDGKIAVWDVEGWVFFTPTVGWRAEVIAEQTCVVFGTTGWVAPGDLPQRFTQLGVNATADAVNRLSVSAAATPGCPVKGVRSPELVTHFVRQNSIKIGTCWIRGSRRRSAFQVRNSDCRNVSHATTLSLKQMPDIIGGITNRSLKLGMIQIQIHLSIVERVRSSPVLQV